VARQLQLLLAGPRAWAAVATRLDCEPPARSSTGSQVRPPGPGPDAGISSACPPRETVPASVASRPPAIALPLRPDGQPTPAVDLAQRYAPAVCVADPSPGGAVRHSAAAVLRCLRRRRRFDGVRVPPSIRWGALAACCATAVGSMGVRSASSALAWRSCSRAILDRSFPSHSPWSIRSSQSSISEGQPMVGSLPWRLPPQQKDNEARDALASRTPSPWLVSIAGRQCPCGLVRMAGQPDAARQAGDGAMPSARLARFPRRTPGHRPPRNSARPS